MLGQKKCKECGVVKPLAEFYPSGNRHQTNCKPCHNGISYRNRVRREYGLTVEEVNELLARGCEVCGTTDRLVVDHDHATGVVRGCLCNAHNLALGNAQDDPAILRALAEYLEAR